MNVSFVAASLQYSHTGRFHKTAIELADHRPLSTGRELRGFVAARYGVRRLAVPLRETERSPLSHLENHSCNGSRTRNLQTLGVKQVANKNRSLLRP